MITPTSAWSTEFAKRQRKPLFVVEIAGYHYAFTNHTYLADVAVSPAGVFMENPVTPSTGERVRWAFPTSATAQDDSGGPLITDGSRFTSNGYVEAHADGSGELNLNGSGPLANLGFHAKWTNFVLPSLPPDAVVTHAYTVQSGERVIPPGTQNAVATISSTIGGTQTDTGDFSGFYHIGGFAASLASIPTAVVESKMLQSTSGVVGDDWKIFATGIAIYYTSAMEDSGAWVGGSEYFKPWLKPAPQDLELTVDDLNGSATLGQLAFDVLDLKRLSYPILADMPDFVFEGKQATLKIGTTALDYPDLLTLYTGDIESVVRMDNNAGWTFTCNDGSAKLDSVIWTTGDDGQPTDSDHPKTISGNPIDILLSILRTDLGISDARIDVARLEDYRDTYFAGMLFTFRITDPPQARDFIQKQLMVPLGGILWINNLGVHSVRFMAPLDGDTDPVMSLTKRDLSSTPIAGQAGLINTISFRFDKNDSGSSSSNNDYLSISIQHDQDSIDKYGLYGEHIIESDGLRASSQGFFIASFVARMIFLRYGNKNLTFPADGQWKLAMLEPFDLIQFTHPQVPDRVNGVFGITDWLLQVLDRTYGFEAGKVSLRVVDASEMAKYGRYKIAPDGTNVWTSATPTEQGRYMYLSEDSGLMSNGDPTPILG